MKLIDFLNAFGGYGLLVSVYSIEDDENALWEGTYADIPWWVAQYKLKVFDEGESAIDFRRDFKDGAPGIVICVE